MAEHKHDDIVKQAMEIDRSLLRAASKECVMKCFPMEGSDTIHKRCQDEIRGPLVRHLLGLVEGLQYTKEYTEEKLVVRRSSSEPDWEKDAKTLFDFWASMSDSRLRAAPFEYEVKGGGKDKVETREAIHATYFPAANFSRTAVELAQKPFRGNYSEYVGRKELVTTLEVYAKYLMAQKIKVKKGVERPFLGTEDWKAIKELTSQSVLGMGRVMDGELARDPEAKRTASDIAKAEKLVHGLGLDGKDDLRIARSQLVLLGICPPGAERTPEYYKECLSDACAEYVQAFNAVRTIDSETLKTNDDMFNNVKRAIWWARYFCTAMDIKTTTTDSAKPRGDATTEQRLENERQFTNARQLLLDHKIVSKKAYDDTLSTDCDYFLA